MSQTDTCMSFLWAKKKEQNGQFFWLPLTLHLKDTMGVMDFLWHHWVSEGQKEIIIHALSDTGEEVADTAQRLACFLQVSMTLVNVPPFFRLKRVIKIHQIWI